MNVAPPVSASTFVIAAVSVVFPWSTCPIVPTLQCGFVRSNFAFAMSPGPYLQISRLILTVLPRRPRAGAGDGNRTHVASLEGWSSTIELHPQPCAAPLPVPLRHRSRRRSGGGGRIRTYVGVRQRVYSPSPLATRAPLLTRAGPWLLRKLRTMWIHSD